MWVEKYTNFWVHQESKWIVRDYNTQNDEEGWVILDQNEMMFSCHWLETKEECMAIVEQMIKEQEVI